MGINVGQTSCPGDDLCEERPGNNGVDHV